MKYQASLSKCGNSPEPSLLVYTKYEYRGRLTSSTGVGGSRKFNLGLVFYFSHHMFHEGRVGCTNILSEPSSAPQQSAILMAFRSWMLRGVWTPCPVWIRTCISISIYSTYAFSIITARAGAYVFTHIYSTCIYKYSK